MFRVRPQEPRVIPAIARVANEAWHWAYRGLLPDELLDQLAVEWFQARWEHQATVAPPERRVWVIETDGAGVVGFSGTGPTRDEDLALGTGEVYSINVEPGYVGRGVGRQLFAHAVGDLSARGYAPLTLWVLRGNEQAIRFYESAGWAADGGEQVNSEWFPGFELHEVRYRLS